MKALASFFASILASILESLASKAAEYMVDTTAAQLSWVFKRDSKCENLWGKVQELKDARQGVQQSVDEAKRKGEKIFDDVERWLTVVNEKISDQATTQSQEDEKKEMENYLAGFLLGIKNRYQLSKKAEEEAEAITQLLNEKDRFDRVSYRPALEGISIRPVKEYKAFGSRRGAFIGAMAALEDDNVNLIGVYGMGGVGKTTLVKEAARQASEKKLFDEVVFVAVTQTPNTVNIQDEIVEKLGLKIEERIFDVRAARLHDRLKKINKVLIILDDIWEEHDLEALGIPSVDKHKGLKILMTSRRLEVLKSMGSEKVLPIELLKEDEAWKLFKNVAGPIAERSEFKATAEKVAQKCARLPIAIATVAKALKHKENLYEWEDALERELSGDVHSAIEMSYNYLEREELKETFLLCSIMGHNAATDDLLKYCRGLGLFRGLDTIEKARRRVLTLVSELQDSSLLLAGSSPERFDMHDVVCEVAIAIASKNRGWLASGKEDVSEEWSDKDRMRTCSLISLENAKFSELPDELECPKLTFFSMCSENSSSKWLFFSSTDKADLSSKIPINLFEGMKGLNVLNFTRFNFTSLPSSIGSLRRLCTLRLVGCDLEDIVMLGELVNLEILDLRNSTIRVLPKEIGQLRRLKLLDLSGCSKLEVISPNVLSSLSRLEELYLYYSFNRWDWEVEGNESNPRSNASLVELQNLSRLTTLEVDVPDVRAIPKRKLFSRKMERYRISIGGARCSLFDSGMETSRQLQFTTNISLHLIHDIKTLLRNAQSLYLEGVKDAMDMLCDPITEGCPDLKHLTVSDVSDIKFVVNPSMLVSSSLECLSLKNLMNLEAICDGQLKAGSFGRLRSVEVCDCQILKNLFSFSVAKGLRQLEEIEVEYSQSMSELITVEKEEIGEDDTLEFTQLRSLALRDLPAFNGMWYSQKTFQFARWIFDKKVLFPAALKTLYLESVNGIEKIWHDDHLFTVSSLTYLEVFGCNKLKCAFTSSVVESLVNLETVIVGDCDEMEDIIEGILGGEERINSSIKVFPKLQVLRLFNLPNLKRFCSGINPIEFPFLRQLEIMECPVLSTFHFDTASIGNISVDPNVPQPQYLFSAKVIFPVLEELGICCGIEIFSEDYDGDYLDLSTRRIMEERLWEYCFDDTEELLQERFSGGMENVERLWPIVLDEHSYSKLTSFSLEGCPKLLNVFSIEYVGETSKA